MNSRRVQPGTRVLTPSVTRLTTRNVSSSMANRDRAAMASGGIENGSFIRLGQYNYWLAALED